MESRRKFGDIVDDEDWKILHEIDNKFEQLPLSIEIPKIDDLLGDPYANKGCSGTSSR